MNRSLSIDMQRFGNLATRSQLRGLGHSDRDIHRAIDGNMLRPLRQSWVAHPGADPLAMRAVALRGRLAASSALLSLGVWVTKPAGLWLGTAVGASRVPPTEQGEHRIWVREHFPSSDERRWRMSVSDSLEQYARLGSAPDIVASIDSALNAGLVTADRLDEIFARLPRRVQRLRHRVNGKSQSGLESLFRIAAEDAGWKVDIQVKVSRVGHVDILIDGWLVVELDGSEWHDTPEAQEEDRRRDAELILLGYRYHRFRHSQVLHRMPLCLDVVRTILASGRPLSVR
ncbi:endonuclease domain-containing protein [Leifsonia kafniensis]